MFGKRISQERVDSVFEYWTISKFSLDDIAVIVNLETLDDVRDWAEKYVGAWLKSIPI